METTKSDGVTAKSTVNNQERKKISREKDTEQEGEREKHNKLSAHSFMKKYI